MEFPQFRGNAGAAIQSRVRALLELDLEVLGSICSVLEAFRGNSRKLLIVGNGGSAATASHFVNDLSKGVGMPALKAISLMDQVSLATAWANDLSYVEALGSMVKTLGSPGDLLVAFSTSGRSENIIGAARVAKEMGMQVLTMTGAQKNPLSELSDLCLHVGSDHCEMIEDLHLIACHLLVENLRRRD